MDNTVELAATYRRRWAELKKNIYLLLLTISLNKNILNIFRCKKRERAYMTIE